MLLQGINSEIVFKDKVDPMNLMIWAPPKEVGFSATDMPTITGIISLVDNKSMIGVSGRSDARL